MRVLDVGAGLGGSARHLAGHYGVEVTGIEISPDLVRLADRLTDRAEFGARIQFQRGNALSAPFPMHAFDCVWIQHVLSSVTAKSRLFAELRRILVPTGVLALHEIVALDVRAVRYPLPWARSPLTHFPATARRLRTAIESAGFTLRVWRDTTPAARQWWREVARDVRDELPHGWPALLGSEAAVMLDNLVFNLDEGCLGVAIAVFDRSR
jgi:ubiquinone/menaquinone biosynthesis C-methylase UbiE